jgi:hypothetical protein
LIGFFFGEIGAHVLDEGAGNGGRPIGGMLSRNRPVCRISGVSRLSFSEKRVPREDACLTPRDVRRDIIRDANRSTL